MNFPRTRNWSAGPPADWDEIRERLRSYSDQVSGRTSEAVAPAPLPRSNGRPPHVIKPAVREPARRMPMGAPAAEDVDFGIVFDLPFIRWWKVHNPLVMQRAVLVLCVLIALLLLLLHAF